MFYMNGAFTKCRFMIALPVMMILLEALKLNYLKIKIIWLKIMPKNVCKRKLLYRRTLCAFCEFCALFLA